MTKEEYLLYHESKEELDEADALDSLPERCRQCKYLQGLTCNYSCGCFYDRRHYCSECKFCHNYGTTDELYCDILEDFVDEIDCCDDFEEGD